MKFFLLMLSAMFILMSCSESLDPNYDNDLAKIDSLDLKSAIGLANDWKFTNSKISSHITPTELIIQFPDGREVKKTLPPNEMYIAVAPYVNSTHDCSTHYPSSCDAELKEKTFKLTAKDTQGNTLLDGNITSMKNGFFELWLPRDLTITLHVEYNNLSADEVISTFAVNKTCITTAKLK